MPAELVKQEAKLDDTIALIVDKINADYNTPYISAVCEKYNSSDPNLLAFLARLQDYVHRNVRYQLDIDGKEFADSPTVTIINGEGDCKKMTIIIGCVLLHSNIPFYLKHVFYSDVDYTHIYVIVPYPCKKGYITLDPVQNSIFDNEVKHYRAHTYDKNGTKMDLYTRNTTGYRATTQFADGSSNIMDDLSFITGVGCTINGLTSQQILDNILLDEDTISGIGKKSKEEKKERRKKLSNTFKQVGLEVPRAAFLGLVALNALKFASRLVKAWSIDKGKVTATWQGLGGNIEDLKKAIVKGSKQQINGIGVVVAATIAAGVVTATPIIIAVKKLLDDLKVKENPEDDKQLEDELEKGEQTASHLPPTSVRNMASHAPPLASNMPPSNGTPDPPPGDSIGGESLEINSWSTLLYTLWRWGFYSGLPVTYCYLNNDFSNFKILSACSIGLAAIGIYWIFAKQSFFKLNFFSLTKKTQHNG